MIGAINAGVLPQAADPAVVALQDLARRVQRGGAPRCVLLLRLSASPAIRPHHSRVARAILTDVAQRLDGEVLRLRRGDLALICRSRQPADAIGPEGRGPEGLPSVLNRLFAAVGPMTDALFTDWRLPGEATALLAAISLPPTTPDPTPQPPQADPLPTVEALLDFASVPELMRRQIGIRISPAGSRERLLPLFEEVTVSMDALEHRIAAYGQTKADACVFRYLAGRLDGRVLAALNHGGAAAATAPALHVNLALSGATSAALADLARACRAQARGLAVEISVMDAAGDPDRFAGARDHLAECGVALVLDGLTAENLPLLRPRRLGASLVKLAWSPAFTRATPDALKAALAEIGADHIVLHRAETEAALAWGIAQGLTAFQGRHVDAMRAAYRLSACAHAPACTLGDCMGRAAALSHGGRLGCGNLALLDGAELSPA